MEEVSAFVFVDFYACNQNIRVFSGVQPAQNRAHIFRPEADASTGAAPAAMQKNGTAPARNDVWRAVKLQYTGQSVVKRVIREVLYVVTPRGVLRVFPLLPSVEIRRLRIADPIRLRRYLPPGKLQTVGRQFVAEC